MKTLDCGLRSTVDVLDFRCGNLAKLAAFVVTLAVKIRVTLQKTHLVLDELLALMKILRSE